MIRCSNSSSNSSAKFKVIREHCGTTKLEHVSMPVIPPPRSTLLIMCVNDSHSRRTNSPDLPFTMDDQQHGINMGSIQSLGIMNALKTGDPKVDMILALMMPFALNYLLSFAGKVAKLTKEAWTRWWCGQVHVVNYHERCIAHRSQFNADGYRVNHDGNTKNDDLIKAIRLYLHSNVDMKLVKADVDLTKSPVRCNYPTVAKVLSACHLVKNPPANEWHKLGYYSKPPALVELSIENQQNSAKDDDSGQGDQDSSRDKKVEVEVFRLRSLQGSAIDDFLDTAFKWYVDELRKSEDLSRYYYELEGDDSFDFNSQQRRHRMYTRFKLSNEKTFGSLFFPEKETILKLVDNFLDKTGKYAIRGYPHKLGVLLHGPPGTGKTSFIKALAEYTDRHVVNVPIAKIKTNAELTSMFFDKNYSSQDGSVNMDFKDVIYVMEDIDAVSDIVKRRDGKKTAQVIQTSHIDLPAPKSLWRMLVESENDDCKNLVKVLMSKSERLKSEATKPEVVRSVTKRLMALPALGLVGETEDKTLQALLSDAIKSSETLMKEYASVDQYLGAQAKTLKRILEDGADIDEALVDELLGIERPSLPPLVKRPLSRDVSYSKYDNSKDVYVEMRELKEALMNPHLPGSTSRAEGGETNGIRSSYAGLLKPQDSLNLQGILNVLDGVVDTPSRIIIMTTNHPEQLDPALIRPGRIDKKVHLGYMDSSDISKMLELYFQTNLDEKQKTRIETAIKGDAQEKRPALNFTPAQVEQMASEFDSVDNMICALEEKAFEIAVAPSDLLTLGTTATEVAFGL